MLDDKFWKKYFQVYDVLNFLIPYNELMDELINELQCSKGMKVLDAGAGTGNLSIKLSKLGCLVIALDNISEALSRIRAKDDSIRIIKHDLTERLPFDNNFFDRIVSNNVIYSIPKEKRIKLLLEFKRILKPEGRIVVSSSSSGCSPIKIYLYHLKKDLKNIGIFRLFIKIIKMSVPTLKMFYYNAIINREAKKGDFEFISKGDMPMLFDKIGLNVLTKEKKVYANQALLSSAEKNKSYETGQKNNI